MTANKPRPYRGMICRCGMQGALIETHAPGYGRHWWHLGCLRSWQAFTAGSRQPPTRYLWEAPFDFDTPLVMSGRGRQGNDDKDFG